MFGLTSYGDDKDGDVGQANWGHIGATPLAGPPLLILLLPRIVLIHTYDYMEAFLGGHLLLFTHPDAFELVILGTGCKNGTPLSVTKGMFTVY